MKIITKIGYKIKNSFESLASGLRLFYFFHPWALGRGIVAGPFKGTKMALRTSWNTPICLFVGSYEKELHATWNILSKKPIKTAWVIGAAEGYYACGIAKKWNAKVLAYEACDNSRIILARNVELNGMQSNVQILGKCEPDDFAVQLKEAAPDLIVCDIEGGEDGMFSTEILSRLARTILIIETHPPYGLLPQMKALSMSHDVEIINPIERQVSDYPFPDLISRKTKLQWLQEGRPFATPWIVAFPKK